VQVLSADPKLKRIALSIKALQGPPARPPEKPKPKPEPTMEDKLSALADRWKRR
jgi:uncharacterized protein